SSNELVARERHRLRPRLLRRRLAPRAAPPAAGPARAGPGAGARPALLPRPPRPAGARYPQRERQLLRGRAHHRGAQLRELVGDGEIHPARRGHRVSADVPFWLELVIAPLLIGSGLFVLTSAVGFVRLPQFFLRMHPPALAYTAGSWCAT